MGIVAMQKVAVLSPRSARETVLDVLQQQGVLQVLEAPASAAVDHTEMNFRAAELQWAMDTLKDFAHKQTEQALRKKPTPENIIAAATHTDVRGIVDRLNALEQEDTNAQRSLDELRQRTAVLEPWRGLPNRLDAPAATVHAIRLYGFVPAPQLPQLFAMGDERGLPLVLETYGEANGAVAVAATMHKGSTSTFEERATAIGWTDVQLPQLAGTPADILNEDKQRERELLLALEQHRKERVAMSAELPLLRNVSLFLAWQHDKQVAREALSDGFATSTLLGWVPKADVSMLEQTLLAAVPGAAIFSVRPAEGEDAPVYLKNSAFITPFESVTTLYGLPLQSDMDPTAALAPFFALYFALCLTDAGYGLALALIFGIFLLIRRPTPKDASLAWLLFISGVVSIIVGALFGGWFGLTPQQVPDILTVTRPDSSRWFAGQVWNLSQQDGITFLQYLSLTLGIAHIFFGVFLAGWHKWVHGAKGEAFWQHFTSHLLLGAVIFYAVAPATMSDIALWMLLAVVALNVWGKGYGSPWYVRPIMGVLGLINFGIGLLSNGLSYLRILALGLVTGAIALAINQVAIEMGKLFPVWLAIPVMIVIALLGHIVSIALNTLGAFIHSGRLQFIEFFGQFFEGGGRPYTPFKRSIS